AKKLRHLKRFFQLAVEREQIDTSPLRFVKLPRSPKGKVRAYTSDECAKILKAASGFSSPIPWELLIHTAMATGMRRAELLNATWRNINFAEMTIEVAPKGNTDETWEWHIKDAERRTLPLTNELTTMLVNHQSGQPEGHPYVFIPPERYAFIQELRRQGRWAYSDSRLRVLNNFRRDFTRILRAAGIEVGTFHDLRRTCLSGWLAHGLTEYDVMQLAGHSEFSTTHRFYLAVRSDLIDRARAAGMKGSFGAQLARASISG
ncbi:MAG: tyrosine-type recombinase/integrase, partial [Phycisphaerales bacterium]